jgi:hypothetical protein
MKTILAITALMGLSVAGYTALAEQKTSHCSGPWTIHCPRCHCCVPSVDVEKIKEHCWEIECEPICIPHVTFPWERKHCSAPCGEISCPPAKGAKVRNVRVLKLVEYECKVCKYTWKPACLPPAGCASPSAELAPTGARPAQPALDLPAPPASTKARQSIKHWKFGF